MALVGQESGLLFPELVVCTLIFFGYGLNNHAEMEFYQLAFVIAGV
jgi:uncharacterized protein